MAATEKIVKGKKIKIEPEIRIETYEYGLQIYSLPDKPRLPKYSLSHERLCADLYVAYFLAGARFWKVCDTDYDDFEIVGLIPDRQFIYDTKVIFLEVDRGGEDYNTPDGIRGKVEKYIHLSKLHRNHRFHVCFTTIDELYPNHKIKRTADRRAKGILKVFEEYERRDQFMVTLHKYAVAMPEEAIWATEEHPLGVSLICAT